MRTFLCAVLALAAGCGDGDAPPVAKAPPAPEAPPVAPRPAAPFEAWFDEPALIELLFDAAKHANLDEVASLKLPPRCDRVRAAVRFLQDVLRDDGKKGAPIPLAAALDVIDALAKVEGGPSAAALAPLAAKWRAWTPAEVAAETAIVRRFAAAADLVDRAKPDPAAALAALEGMPPPPPGSVTAAQALALRAAALALTLSGDASVPQPLADAYDAAERAFDALGWPAGIAALLTRVADGLLAQNPKSFRATHMAELAQAAYARSGDELRASGVFLVLARAAIRRGDLRDATGLADAGRERLRKSPARGAEVVDTLLLTGRLAQASARQTAAVRDLGAAWDEARWALLPASRLVAIAERYATTLVIVGRFDDAYAVTREAAAADDAAVARGAPATEPERTTLDEIAAQAALDAGRAAESRDLYRAAVARLAGRPVADGPMHERTLRLLAAQSDVRAGNADAAAAEVAKVLAEKGVAPPTRAHAASVLREAKKYEDAARELAAAEKEGGAALTAALLEERARLAAARGDVATARDAFRRAVDRVVSPDPDRPLGWEAARVLCDWARMERDAGRDAEASDLAGRGVVELAGSGLEMELDRARELYVSLQRRRLWFVDAEKATIQRIAAGPPGAAARRDDALLDLLLIRIERLLTIPGAAADDASSVPEFEEGWRRDAAAYLWLRAKGGSPPAPTLPPDASGRWRLAVDVAAGAADAAALVARAGIGEPELRRWAVRARLLASPNVLDVETRRIAGGISAPPALADGEAMLVVEPLGDRAAVFTLTAAGEASFFAEGDGGLAELWDAANVEPTPERLAAAAKRVGESVLTPALAAIGGAKRLFVCVPDPFGPLPFDLVPCEGGTLLDRFEIAMVPSLREFAAVRARPAPPLLGVLDDARCTLDARHALAAIPPIDAAARARLLALAGAAQNQGRDAGAALRIAKLTLRGETASAPAAKPPRVPAWAAFVLRGAP